METLKKLSLVLSAAVLAMALVVGPAFATEAGGGGETGEEGSGKIQLPERQHDLVGLILIGALGVGGLAALVNARKQLKGERSQATGEFRWR